MFSGPSSSLHKLALVVEAKLRLLCRKIATHSVHVFKRFLSHVLSESGTEGSFSGGAVVHIARLDAYPVTAVICASAKRTWEANSDPQLLYSDTYELFLLEVYDQLAA